MKLEHHLVQHTGINSKWKKDLNIRHKNKKILEENIGNKISDIAHRNFLFDVSPQARKTKEINKQDYIKLKSVCTAKEIISKTKRQPTEWENIFNTISDKGLMSKIYKVFTELNTKKNPQTTQFKNGQRT